MGGGGGKSGGGGTSLPNIPPSPLEILQSQVARQIFLESTPLRTGLLASIEDIFGIPRTIEPSTGSFVNTPGHEGRPGPKKFQLTPIAGGMPVNPFGIFAPARQAIEEQYPVARENILSNTPIRGGQLNDALVSLERGRASEVGGLKERSIQNALGAASGVAFGTPQTVLGAHDSSVQRQALAAQIASANAGAGASKKGSGLGALGSLGGAAAGRLIPSAGTKGPASVGTGISTIF